MLRNLLLLVLLLGAPACLYRAGGGLVAGMLDEVEEGDRSGGITAVGDRLLERQLVAELGHQLGSGVIAGATEISPEQQAALEALVDGILQVAATRTGAGLRNEVSPELRAMVRRDIVAALSEGLRGEVGASLEEVMDRAVSRAMLSLQEGIDDPALRLAVADLLRESIYLAMREGRPGRPNVGETLEATLSEHLLYPFERSIGGLTETVADRVDASARRTENTLRAIIATLVVVLGVIALLYAVAQRQLRREREASRGASATLRTFDAVLGTLDDETRRRLEGKLKEYAAVAGGDRSHGYERDDPAGRSDDYTRRGPDR